MLQLYQNIRRFREEQRMSQTELAKLTGYGDRSMIAKIEAGKVDLAQSKIKAFADALGVSCGTLMGWDEPAASVSPVPPAQNILPLQLERVPLLGSIACGEPIYADEEHDQYVLAEEGLHADFALRCKGDSMIGARIQDGDIVFIRKQATVENGEIAAVLIDDDATLKRIYRSDTAISLVAENPKYAPLIYTLESFEEVRILGKAIAFQSAVK